MKDHILARYHSFVKILAGLATTVVVVTVLDLQTIWQEQPTSSSLSSSSLSSSSLSSSLSIWQDKKVLLESSLVLSSSSNSRSGTLDLSVEGDDEGMAGKCVAVRLKAHSNVTLSLDEALPWIFEQYQYSKRPLQVGLIFLDKPDGFLSSGKVVNQTGVFHLYHYLEFLLVAYQQLQVVLQTLTHPRTNLHLSSSDSPVQVPWIYVPLLQAPIEVCGVAQGMNCAIAQTLLQVSQWYGMESNPQRLRDIHSAYHGQHAKRQWDEVSRPLNHSQNYRMMQETADVTLILSLRRRDRCRHQGRNQHGWNFYAANFPHDAWHDSLVQALTNIPLPDGLPKTSITLAVPKPQQSFFNSTTTTTSSSSTTSSITTKPLESFFSSTPQQLTVCYIDRQSTTRRMPDSEHEWLVDYLSHHDSIRFWHLHMQNYTGMEQVKIATQCQLLMGVHGNGLSHLLWMTPRRYVLEWYWDDKLRQGGYQLLAETMQHSYLAIRKGLLVLDATHPDPQQRVQQLPNDQDDPLRQGRHLVMQFVNRALSELGIPGAPSWTTATTTMPGTLSILNRDNTRGSPGKPNHPHSRDTLRKSLPVATKTKEENRAVEAHTTHRTPHVDDWGNTYPRHCHGHPKHVHLAVGRDPQRQMTVSFASQWSDGNDGYPSVIAGVRYGPHPHQLIHFVGEAQETSGLWYNTTYPNGTHIVSQSNVLYFSPYQHHVTLSYLVPGTTYYYRPVVARRHVNQSWEQNLLRLASKSWKQQQRLLQLQDTSLTADLKQNDSVLGRSYDNKTVHSKQRRRVLAPKPYNGSGKPCPALNQVRSLTTAAAPEHWRGISLDDHDETMVRFGIVGDLGQFVHSQETLKHMLRGSSMDVVLLVGDIAYTNNDHRRWDTFFDFLDDYPIFHSTPLQIATGNHDVEKAPGRGEIFQAYETRFRMPQVHRAQLGTYDSDDDLDRNELPYPLPYEWGNAYYSFVYGPTKHIVVSAYSSMEPNSTQYEWLVDELALVNRDQTPWVLVTIHVPLYNTFQAHQQKDLQIVAARQHLEPLFVQYSVNVIFSGHVHAYQRTKNVAFGTPTVSGPTYLTVGASGRQCCLTPFVSEIPERWVAARDGTHYGYGQLAIYNRTHAKWEWIPTSTSSLTDDLPPGDKVILENQFYLKESKQ